MTHQHHLQKPGPQSCIQPFQLCRIVLGCIIFPAINLAIANGVERDPRPLPSRPVITKALHRAVSFFRNNASAHGGYVFQISSDLSKREGEGKVTATTAWIEPPGTPAVGLAFLQAYRLCKDPILLEAAKETAEALRHGQLESGGWDTASNLAAKKEPNTRIAPKPEKNTKANYATQPPLMTTNHSQQFGS